jgi:formiminotetrahydrofolate cyclodeaminase
MEFFKMPATTDEEKERKDHLIQEALRGATETPLEIARACLEILKIVDEVAPIGNTMAISDAGVAAYLAEAALRAALLNVDINLPNLKDEAFAQKARDDKEGLIEQARQLKDRALATISGRMAG